MALAHLVHRNLLEKNADDKDPVPDSEELVQVRWLKVYVYFSSEACLL